MCLHIPAVLEAANISFILGYKKYAEYLQELRQ